MKSRDVRFLLVCTSALAAIFVWQAFVRRDGGSGETVGMVENRDAVDRLLARRAIEDGSGDPEFVLAPFPETDAVILFPSLAASGVNEFDELAGYRHRSGIRRDFQGPDGTRLSYSTNDHGFRQDEDVRRERPEVRILLTGDSHTEVGSNSRLISAQLARAIEEERAPGSVEVLNAGAGGYTFHNYVGVLVRWLHLRPHTFVCIVYGGNDFLEAVLLRHYRLRTTPRDLADERTRRDWLKSVLPAGAFGQALQQAAYLGRFPSEGAGAVEDAVACILQMRQICDDHGIRFLCVYLPPMLDAQPRHHRPKLERLVAELGFSEEDLRVADGLADAWMARTREGGVRVLDLRPAFRAVERSIYWESDFHVNEAGAAIVARETSAALRGPP